MAERVQGAARLTSAFPSLAMVLLFALLLPFGAQSMAGQGLRRVWLGPDGDVLPFQNDEELLAFLRTAEIASTTDIPEGVTRPRQALLELNGLQVHATLKDIDETYKRQRMSDGTFAMELRDYYVFEQVAYQLAMLLGLDNVPPTILRRYRRNESSVQLWVYGAITENERRERGMHPPHRLPWMRQVQTMYVFDDLIGNVDRNGGDILIDDDWKLWMVDHSRAFQTGVELRFVEKVLYCRRDLFEAMKALDEAAIRQHTGHQLTRYQISALLERRDLVVAHIQALIDERGEAAVLY
jgi:hypothetical protein